ncbi:MAG TPA: hypothetical protein VGW75_10525 [Solirubrobacteraceae bacterium]|nr:hypothetical protein [Solirubrobacteraceae bacterium]
MSDPEPKPVPAQVVAHASWHAVPAAARLSVDPDVKPVARLRKKHRLAVTFGPSEAALDHLEAARPAQRLQVGERSQRVSEERAPHLGGEALGTGTTRNGEEFPVRPADSWKVDIH